MLDLKFFNNLFPYRMMIDLKGGINYWSFEVYSLELA